MFSARSQWLFWKTCRVIPTRVVVSRHGNDADGAKVLVGVEVGHAEKSVAYEFSADFVGGGRTP